MIDIAQATRRWERDGHPRKSLATLVFDPNYCQFLVRYIEVCLACTNHTKSQIIPSQCTLVWLDHFVRDQSTLQPDSYFITEQPNPNWELIIKEILSTR